MDGDDDLLMAMARELVQERGIGESADAIWKNLRKQQEEVFNIRSEPESREGSQSASLLEIDVGNSDQIFATAPVVGGPMHQLVLFGQSGVLPERTKNRRLIRKGCDPQLTQLSLFETL